MDGPSIQDRLSKAWGVAARQLGLPYIVYKPNGTSCPIASRNRVIRLNAIITPGGAGPAGVVGYSGVLWRGTFDSAYTKAGYYLVSNDATFFIAAQWPLQPVQCILTTDLVTIARTQVASTGAYAGFIANYATQIIVDWPACLAVTSSHISGRLPEAQFGNWTALLPALAAPILVADILSDQGGRRFVVAAAQLTALGWRLGMKQIEG